MNAGKVFVITLCAVCGFTKHIFVIRNIQNVTLNTRQIDNITWLFEGENVAATRVGPDGFNYSLLKIV